MAKNTRGSAIMPAWFPLKVETMISTATKAAAPPPSRRLATSTVTSVDFESAPAGNTTRLATFAMR